MGAGAAGASAGGAAFGASTGGQWGSSGLGALSVFVDDEASPALIVPLALSDLLGLDQTHGRAWVGFTAATGADVWQTHDVLGWHFTSLREPSVV